MGMEANIDAMADMPIEELFASCASLSRLLRNWSVLEQAAGGGHQRRNTGRRLKSAWPATTALPPMPPRSWSVCPRLKWALLPGAGGTSVCRA